MRLLICSTNTHVPSEATTVADTRTTLAIGTVTPQRGAPHAIHALLMKVHFVGPP